MIEARIPLMAAQGAQVNLADIYRQKQERDLREQQMQMQSRQMDFQERRLDFQEQQMIAKMSAEEREAAKEGLKDMHAAVQWADTPEKWAQVQRAYAQTFPDAANYGFDAREQVLLSLGQMGQYLENTAPEIRTIDAGGSVAALDPRTGQPTFTVLPNPGDQPAGAPVRGQGQSSGNDLTFEQYRGAVNGLGREGAAAWLQRNNITVAIQSDAEFDALPSGATFKAPDGTIRRKP